MSRRGRGRIARLFFSVLVLAAVAAVGLAPQILARPSFRDRALASALPLIKGRITVGGAALGWMKPVHFERVQVFDDQDRPAITIETLDGDRPLWRMALGRSSPGNFRLQKVRLDAIPDPQGSNLVRLIAPVAARRPTTLGVEIVDGLLAVHRPGADPLALGPFQLAIDIKDDPGQGPRELVIRPGKLLDKALIASPKSGDVLKYAMPVLAEADVSGQFSLELDGWRLPLDALQKGSGSGRLLIHGIEVEPGPLAQRLADVLHYPATIHLAREATVPFAMSEGRIHHRDLTFTLRNLTVRSQGSVGLDQTLDLVAKLELPSLPATGPLLQALREVSIPIRGTLDRPVVDHAALQHAGAGVLRNALDGFLRRRSERSKNP